MDPNCRGAASSISNANFQSKSNCEEARDDHPRNELEEDEQRQIMSGLQSLLDPVVHNFLHDLRVPTRQLFKLSSSEEQRIIVGALK